MSVLDTAARYRETLLYNRYQAGRDNIERFRREILERANPRGALFGGSCLERSLRQCAL